MNIIVEGIDRVGKSTFCRMLHNELVMNRIAIPNTLHFGKPNESFCGSHQADVQRFDYFWTIENAFPYYTQESGRVLICDRFHLGEFVYPNLYRDYKVGYQKKIERFMPPNTLLLLFTADSEVIYRRFDGETYLENVDVPKALKLFEEAFERSIIPMKIRVELKWDKYNSVDSNENNAGLLSHIAVRDIVAIIRNYKVEPLTQTIQFNTPEELENAI